MIKKHGLIVCIIGLGLSLTSCYSDIHFEDLMPEPVPVINAIASTDTVVLASVSRTYTETDNVHDLYVKDADVILNVNDGELREKMTMVEFDTVSNTRFPIHVVAYRSDYRPKAGDRLEITAATPYGIAKASDHVPEPVSIQGVETSFNYKVVPGITIVGNTIVSYYNKVCDVTYHVKFHDPAGVKNYYFVNVVSADADYYGFSHYIDYVDPLFSMQNQDITDIGNEGLRNGWGWTFSDETIDGLDYSLALRDSDYPVNDSEENSQYDVRVLIKLYSISEDYYKYLRSVLKDEEREESAIGDIGILEPVVIYSNVEGGTGIFGAYSVDEAFVEFKIEDNED